MAVETKLGAYICTGCDIGKSVDIEALEKLCTDELKIPVCKTHEKLCATDALKMIQDDIKSEELNRVIIAGCSPRVKTKEFTFDNGAMADRCVLREHVAWILEPNDEDTQMAAEDYLRMSAARMRATELPEANIEEIDKTVLVVGGGMSGMRTALSTANLSYDVVIVEKEDNLGGWARKFTKVFPKQAPYKDLADSGVDELISQVEAHDKITIYKSSTIKKIEGEPGKFEVELEGASDGVKFKIGSIVLASGWKPYDPEKLGHLGYGKSNVVTNVQVEEMTSNGGIKRPSDGQVPKSVAFIQCAGSRDQDHLPYCSAVCCRVSLKQATYIKEAYPDTLVYILYKDIRSPGQYEEFYKNVQENEGVCLTKGEVVRVDSTAGDGVEIELEDTLFGENVIVQADMLVLASGMVPTTKVEDLTEGETETAEALSDDNPADSEDKEDANTGASAEAGARILNLTYRKGTDLPTLKYGFPDSHYICFPYETLRTGIYAAGAVRAPMDLASADNDAYGAGLKAIQALELTAKGQAVHPRAGDETFPDFFLQRCTQCKRCTEECPFGTLDEDEKGTPEPHPNRCRRCGICMGACPERIVSFKDYSVHIIGEMIKSLEVPDEEDEKPRALAFMCENDAIPSLDIAAAHRLKISPFVRIIPLRCLGSMNIVWIADALSVGIDGAILIGCKHGDDYQCHFVKGSELANTRMENVREKLKQLVLEEERVQITELALSEWKKVPEVLNNFMDDVDAAGPNPYKGF
ncbi:heterodisulfide reductase subunit A [candidate division LCP-89 bacterium B3_LCP]|uniref:Heterodisulfide reductase subunit A n=1 Tax=candidate division LCP-89 bacterium B3_LCP TaxID=2012998 RepID=A0A532V1E3_UNCL8|nr:MAG: heterodisulfide reductase subunit A [candidate division LCP-89 bacterium B3_LCP]